MASIIQQRVLGRIQNNGFARAKKLADLAIKTNTDSSGKPTARGYQQAVSILEPYIGSSSGNEAIDAQRLVASYSNSLDKIGNRERNQNETVAAFKLQEQDAYFTSFDGDVGGFRDPSALVGATSESLDNLVYGVLNAIDEKDATGESTDALYSYLNDIQKRADSMRDLKNKFETGELGEGQSLDGFGYYVDTNPLDGSIRGAAIFPVGNVPDGMGKGFRRLEATTRVGNGLLPVYAPAQREADGQYVSRIGDATWSGSDGDTLTSRNPGSSGFLIRPGEFSLADRQLFSARTNKVDRGQFVTGVVGRDQAGNSIDATFYRGNDDKLYRIDEQTLEAFKNDPVLKSKLDGYVPRFSPTDIRELSKEAQPFTADKIPFESKMIGLQGKATEAQAESDRLNNMGFFSQVKESFNAFSRESSQRIAARQASAPQRDWGSSRPNKPDAPAPVGSSAPDIVEQGKNIFRKAASFFGAK